MQWEQFWTIDTKNRRMWRNRMRSHRLSKMTDPRFIMWTPSNTISCSCVVSTTFELFSRQSSLTWSWSVSCTNMLHMRFIEPPDLLRTKIYFQSLRVASAIKISPNFAQSFIVELRVFFFNFCSGAFFTQKLCLLLSSHDWFRVVVWLRHYW